MKKKKLTERSGLKVFAAALFAILFSACFFCGILTLICLQNNVYFDGGDELMQNELYSGGMQGITYLESNINRFETDGGSYKALGDQGEFEKSSVPDGNFIYVIKSSRDEGGAVLYTTGSSSAEHTFGYQKIVFDRRAVIDTVDPSDRLDAYHGFESVPEADVEIESGSVDAYLSGNLMMKITGAGILEGSEAEFSLMSIDPETHEVSYSDRMRLFAESKVGDILPLGIFADNPDLWAEDMFTVEPKLTVYSSDLAENSEYQVWQTMIGSVNINMLTNTANIGGKTYTLGTEEAGKALDDYLRAVSLPLEQRAALISTVNNGLCHVSDIYFKGTGASGQAVTYYIDAYADLTPSVVNSSMVTIQAVRMISALRAFFPALLGVFGILLTVCAVFIICAAGRRAGADGVYLGFPDKIPFEIYLALCVCAVPLGWAAYKYFAYSHVFTQFMNVRIFEAIIGVAIVFGIGLLLAIVMQTLSARLKSKKFFKYTVVGAVASLIVKFFKLIWHLISSLRQTWITLLIIAAYAAVIGFGLLAGNVYICLAALVSASFLVMIWSAGFDKLRDYAKKIRDGDLDTSVDRKYLFGNLRKMADDLEGVGGGVKLAVDERMRSERLKTELITNVSHDLKTPLTSIVNYVDILSKDDISDENAKEHIGILKRQADKMKKLIEDLVEVSKATSGSINVNLERTDLNLLITQAEAEYQDRFRDCGLEPIVKVPKEKLISELDGRLMWRVLDNLCSNVCKYALSGTRVYISAEKSGERAIISFKNISKSSLDISGEDLMERFVRGDSSRNTEGSGLGLSIAKSLCDLQGVGFNVTIDGDLFKAIMEINLSDDSGLLEDEPTDDAVHEEQAEEPAEEADENA